MMTNVLACNCLSVIMGTCISSHNSQREDVMRSQTPPSPREEPDT